jgi:hypothetical protein
LPIICFLGLTAVLALEHSRGAPSERGLRIGAAMVMVWTLVWAFTLSIKAATRSGIIPRVREPSIDEVIRKRRVLLIRVYKVWIIVLAVLLVCGVYRMRDDPPWAVLVCVAISLSVMYSLMWWVARLKRSLK